MSNLRQAPLVNGRVVEERGPRNQTTKVIPSSAVVIVLIRALQVIAVLLVIASIFGNYVQFVGGWPADNAALPLDAAAILYAAVYQVGCSVAQWGCKHQGWWVAYAAALIVSAIPSFFTYNAWAGVWLAVLIGPALSIVAIALIVLFIDMIPEWILVK